MKGEINQMKMNNWKIALLTLTLGAGFLGSPGVSLLSANYAEAASHKYTIAQQPFNINGSKQNIGTINKNGSTYIALRNLNTALGLTTNFNNSTQMIQVAVINALWRLI